MFKETRIYCAVMLKKVSAHVPTPSVVQMMQKESMFEQKFVQITSTGSTSHSKSKQTVQSLVDEPSKE
jgi:hypothetical protein